MYISLVRLVKLKKNHALMSFILLVIFNTPISYFREFINKEVPDPCRFYYTLEADPEWSQVLTLSLLTTLGSSMNDL